MNLSMMIMPVVLVAVEAVKRTELLSTRWLPAVALCIGALCGTVFAIIEPQTAVEHVINGFLYGGAAAGIYDAGASAINK